MPGLAPTLGVTVAVLSLVVLAPLSALAARALSITPGEFAAKAFSARALHAYALSFGAAAAAAAINAVFGLLAAWALVRWRLPGRRWLDALIDLPFALPTAVAGVSLAALWSRNGWIGSVLARAGLQAAYTPVGVGIALVFIGLPFVVRSVEPVLRDLTVDVEEAAASLGAGRVQVLARVVLPSLVPAWTTGATLAFARGVGEYGSVIFIAGNMPYRSEIAPLLITVQLEQFDYAGAAAIALVLLLGSLALLLLVNGVQAWARESSR